MGREMGLSKLGMAHCVLYCLGVSVVNAALSYWSLQGNTIAAEKPMQRMAT